MKREAENPNICFRAGRFHVRLERAAKKLGGKTNVLREALRVYFEGPISPQTLRRLELLAEFEGYSADDMLRSLLKGWRPQRRD